MLVKKQLKRHRYALETVLEQYEPWTDNGEPEATEYPEPMQEEPLKAAEAPEEFGSKE